MRSGRWRVPAAVLVMAGLLGPGGSAPGPAPVPGNAGAAGAAGVPPAATLASLAVAPPPKAATGTPRTFKVYATREGLVGHTTANGHKIVSDDQFVSLPSTLTLAARGKGYYSVRVCSTANSRCVYEPVWDVGPWNTHDDYWSVARTSWTGLPIGLPEAQAAYQDGYNGGKDQFGRSVSNPAGIDLADGAIREGLGIGGSGWVTVTFLWTGGGARGQVATDGGDLNVRSGASTSRKVVGLAGAYAQVPIACRVTGQKVTRGKTSTTTWYRLASGNYASGAYLKIISGSVKTC